MNDTIAAVGLLHWKPVLSALLLPPVPFILLLLIGIRLYRAAAGLGTMSVALALAGLWLSHCEAVGNWLERQVIQPPEPLAAERLSQWRRTLAGRQPLVLVLGGGSESLAPEYGASDLSPESHQRLRYALWLSRQLNNAPLMFSGGAAYGRPESLAEAEIAQRVIQRDYGRSLRWLESASRNTRDNARLSLQLMVRSHGGLGGASAAAATIGVSDLFLVTHGWHMPRAMRAFEEEAARQQMIVRIIAAPMGLARPDSDTWLRWLPSQAGSQRVNRNLHELLGRAGGA